MELGKQFLNQVWKASYRSVCPATGPAGVPVQTEVRPAPDWGLPPGPRLHQGAGRAVLGDVHCSPPHPRPVAGVSGLLQVQSTSVRSFGE